MPEELGKTIASLCLTQRRNNGLMWSHYADSHKGLAIGFDSDCSFFKAGNGKAKQGLKKITYSEKRESAFTGIPIENTEKELESIFHQKR